MTRTLKHLGHSFVNIILLGALIIPNLIHSREPVFVRMHIYEAIFRYPLHKRICKPHKDTLHLGTGVRRKKAEEKIK